ncbi:RNA polymerase sigma factor [Fibrivirga algicola]|uniref:Sigma-70 family RNA polymerase sigma factor n=1 Tax=Fibrivirga algicola TaxID=2950420 RepID=A0ABX0QI39_9BACT|nr:sigma-70 family RNA polymerase sigma factor [Fibrivirga algicola]ARK09641.1 RNA polymerase subunit sigma-70 [Fibrella sp. ES10-3-2-2]NID10528.1 sigma-70 family RNA polymerase sigma factor [Fibrivirga algicola]
MQNEQADEITRISRLQAGDESAFRWLVDTYQKRVFRTALAIVPTPEEAEDVAQEVFIEVYRTIASFRGEASLATWLYRLTTSRALKKERDRKRKKRFAFLTSLFDDDEPERYDPPDFQTPDTVLEANERVQLIGRAVQSLADTQKVAFTLHYQEELSYQEIADVMQTSVSAVESLLFRARQTLRKKLTPYIRS